MSYNNTLLTFVPSSTQDNGNCNKILLLTPIVLMSIVYLIEFLNRIYQRYDNNMNRLFAYLEEIYEIVSINSENIEDMTESHNDDNDNYDTLINAFSSMTNEQLKNNTTKMDMNKYSSESNTKEMYIKSFLNTLFRRYMYNQYSEILELSNLSISKNIFDNLYSLDLLKLEFDPMNFFDSMINSDKVIVSVKNTLEANRDIIIEELKCFFKDS